MVTVRVWCLRVVTLVNVGFLTLRLTSSNAHSLIIDVQVLAKVLMP